MDKLVSEIKTRFAQVGDHRGKNVVFKLHDVLMSGYAMFSLKYPSLLDFGQRNMAEEQNIYRLFGVNKVCSDTQFRTILDEVEPSSIYGILPDMVKLLSEKGGLEGYEVLGDYKVASIDGVEFFQQQDGCQKNDCELNAAKRLKAQLKKDYPKEKFIVVEDALYGTAPNIEQTLANEWGYVINVKSGSHSTLFRYFEQRRANNQLDDYVFKDAKGTTHRFYWMNNVALNGCSTIRTNFLYYEEQDNKGNLQVFSWITSFTIRKQNVNTLMRIGRARWKIENETFNTLKNQGYHFEHNYGHGYKHLCNILALLMLLAFLIDQIVQAADKIFIRIETKIKTKIRLWTDMQALFRTTVFNSFLELFTKIAFLHRIKLE
ncbi:MAG: transposase [Saprospiraceae bacterium]|nr:transposase [Saprospiraceae bacterium]